MQTARWAAERRVNHFAGLALAVGGLDDEHLNFALATPEGTYALRVKMSITRHSLAVRQEVCAMMALNILRRWLNGKRSPANTAGSMWSSRCSSNNTFAGVASPRQ
jgi:molybdopterin-biosynthesis enzyme MoeA-like protein